MSATSTAHWTRDTAEWPGYYYDYTGGGPSDVLSWALWGSLLLGLVLLGAAFVQAARAQRR